MAAFTVLNLHKREIHVAASGLRGDQKLVLAPRSHHSVHLTGHSTLNAFQKDQPFLLWDLFSLCLMGHSASSFLIFHCTIAEIHWSAPHANLYTEISLMCS